ncbi:DUF7563 family protein [Halopiger djelfimassiliensis]|uniref:DUF7563 family protein n=1 Tax=Halopiger djelfimassiliensis TaxID=1293047 RepID=UPI0009DBAE04|nr:hypothetical protein [Halopiger djelfimassiliensis]
MRVRVHCGAYVTDRFRRVFGDADRVHWCSECDTSARLSRRSAIGVAVSDPETSPGQHCGKADA